MRPWRDCHRSGHSRQSRLTLLSRAVIDDPTLAPKLFPALVSFASDRNRPAALTLPLPFPLSPSDPAPAWSRDLNHRGGRPEFGRRRWRTADAAADERALVAETRYAIAREVP